PPRASACGIPASVLPPALVAGWSAARLAVLRPPIARAAEREGAPTSLAVDLVALHADSRAPRRFLDPGCASSDAPWRRLARVHTPSADRCEAAGRNPRPLLCAPGSSPARATTRTFPTSARREVDQ